MSAEDAKIFLASLPMLPNDRKICDETFIARDDVGEFLWFHFNGIAASHYVEHLYEKSGIHYRGIRAEKLCLRFQEIISAAAKPIVNEPVVSHNIDGILAALAAESAVTINEFLRPTLEYIAKHFNEPISIEELANLSLMSQSNLNRYFRRFLRL